MTWQKCMKDHSIKFIIQEKQVDYFAWWPICRDFTVSQMLKKYLGESYKNQVYYFENGDGYWGTDLAAWNQIGRKLVERIAAGKFNLSGLVSDHIYYGKKVFQLCQKMERLDLKIAANRQIGIWLKQAIANYLKLNELGFVAVVSDVEHGFLSKQLIKILKSKNVAEDKLQTYLNKLATSDQETLVFQEQTELLRLMIKYRNEKKLKRTREFDEHVQKFTWLNFGYLGPAWQKRDFLVRIRKMKKEYKNSSVALANHLRYLKNIKHDRQTAEQQLKLNMREKLIFVHTRTFSYLKAYRVDMRHYFCYVTNLVFLELSKRYNIPSLWFRYANEQEILNLLADRRFNVRQVLERSKFYAEIREAHRLTVPAKKEFKNMMDTAVVIEKKQKTDKIFGQAAYLGKIQGRVKIILSPKDINKVKKGDVLVAVYTDPNLLPAMEKAVAFVTDQGGITSHAAIVAREMKKPCLIGTKIATKVLKDGDFVEVDATKGVVKILK